MKTLTKLINEIAEAMEMTTIDLIQSVNFHNEMNEHDIIETEDEIRKHLLKISYYSRMTKSGAERYSKVCSINDSYFKSL